MKLFILMWLATSSTCGQWSVFKSTDTNEITNKVLNLKKSEIRSVQVYEAYEAEYQILVRRVHDKNIECVIGDNKCVRFYGEYCSFVGCYKSGKHFLNIMSGYSFCIEHYLHGASIHGL